MITNTETATATIINIEISQILNTFLLHYIFSIIYLTQNAFNQLMFLISTFTITATEDIQIINKLVINSMLSPISAKKQAIVKLEVIYFMVN